MFIPQDMLLFLVNYSSGFAKMPEKKEEEKNWKK